MNARVSLARQQETMASVLRAWAENMRQRDPLVLLALELGMTTLRISELTGLARTTIDRIAASRDNADQA